MAHKLVISVSVQLMSRPEIYIGVHQKAPGFVSLVQDSLCSCWTATWAPCGSYILHLWFSAQWTKSCCRSHEPLMPVSWWCLISLALIHVRHLDTFFQKVVLHSVCLSFNCDSIALVGYSLNYNNTVNPARGIWQHDSIDCLVGCPLGC